MNTPRAVVKRMSFDGSLLVGTVLAERGFRYIEYPLYRASDLPVASGLRGLVVMDGPRGAPDDVTYPQLPRERNFIKKNCGGRSPDARDAPRRAASRGRVRPRSAALRCSMPSSERMYDVAAAGRNMIGSLLDVAGS